MLTIRRENRLIRDDSGFATGCIAAIAESTKVKGTFDVVFKVAGTEGDITMHLFPTAIISNRKDSDGERNMMTQLCLQFGFVSEKELEDDSFDTSKIMSDFEGLEGQAVKFKTYKPEPDKADKKKGNKKAPNFEQIDVGTLVLFE